MLDIFTEKSLKVIEEGCVAKINACESCIKDIPLISLKRLRDPNINLSDEVKLKDVAHKIQGACSFLNKIVKNIRNMQATSSKDKIDEERGEIEYAMIDKERGEIEYAMSVVQAHLPLDVNFTGDIIHSIDRKVFAKFSTEELTTSQGCQKFLSNLNKIYQEIEKRYSHYKIEKRSCAGDIRAVPTHLPAVHEEEILPGGNSLKVESITKNHSTCCIL